MSIVTQPIAETLTWPVAVPDDFIFRLSVDQYHEMIQAGILTDDDPVELLEGWLIAKMSKNPPHSLVTRLIREVLARMLPEGWFVDSQEPLTTKDSEPEPDVQVLRGNARQYADRHPGPQDVVLIVEVADASLRRDRGTKKRIYARASVPVYWIANLVDNRFEVYSDPTGPGERPDYRQRQDFGPDDMIPVVIEGHEVGRVAVKDLLP